MKLDTISMDKAQAREAYLSYRAAVRDNGSPEDAMMATGYRELAMGHSLVRLSQAIVAGGVGNDGFPRLAVARSDGKQLTCRLDRTSREPEGPRGVVRFHTTTDARTPITKQRSQQATMRYDTVTLSDFPRDTRWPALTMDASQYADAVAITIVPSIPATLRPKAALHNYRTLFEVEHWEPLHRQPRAPRDPALLRHIGGDLYAVLAVWDLTELERAVIAGTRLA